jgi:hypothetical protein
MSISDVGVAVLRAELPIRSAIFCIGTLASTTRWLDIAREYTERWVHQQQICEAVNKPGLTEATMTQPVIVAFVYSTPMAQLSSVIEAP